MRLLIPLLLCAGLKIVSGQTLPPYLIDTFPAANATSVPINVSIVLRARVSLPVPPYVSTGFYVLKSQTGQSLAITSPSNCTCFGNVVLIPQAALAPNTTYTLTIDPTTYPGGIGSAYAFSFTTG